MVHRTASTEDLDLVNALPEGAAVVPAGRRDIPLLAAAYRAARRQRATPVLSGACTVIAVGPLLDTPDRVEVGAIRRDAERIEVTLNFTNVRVLDAPLRRNVPWRPMAEIRLALAPGTYGVRVTWRALRSLPGGAPIAAPRVTELWFRIA